jgi:hypothetical protein
MTQTDKNNGMPPLYGVCRFFPTISLFFLLLSVARCTGLPVSRPDVSAGTSPPPLSFFLSLPSEGGLVFIGVAAKRADPDETLRLALEDAARRVAVFHKVSGEFAVEGHDDPGIFNYINNTYMTLHYDREGYGRHLESLLFNAGMDTLEMENTLIVRTVFPAALTVPVRYRPVYDADQKPSWVDTPSLEIEGYTVGVGFSDRYSSMADTYTNSYHNAIFAIIGNTATLSRSNTTLYEDNGSLFGYEASVYDVTYSYGTLTGFYVLDTWFDPKTKTVWTLAIAEKAE